MTKPKFNPNAPFDVVEEKPKFNPNAPFEVVEETPRFNELESAGLGSIQGASLGWADEIEGAGLGFVDDLKKIFSPSAGEPSKVKRDENGRVVNPEELTGSYEKHRDDARSMYKQAEKENPNSFLAGNLAGSFAVPGSVGAAKAALLGATTGFGLSEGDASQQLMDAATGGAIGAAMPTVMKGVGKAIDKTGEMINPALKKIGKAFFGVDEMATKRYLDNPDIVNKAQRMDDVADDFFNKSLPKMREATSEYSSEAWNSLNPNQGFEKADILQAIVDRQKELAPRGFAVGAADNKALNQLGNLADDISQFGKVISEPEAKHIIQSLDNNINWSNPDAKVSNETLKTIREFIDNNLKEQNPVYRSIMEDTAQSVRDLKSVERMFVNRQSPESHQKFVSAVKNLGTKGDASDLSRGLDKIKTQAGDDVKESLLNSWTKKQFEKGDTQGSRKTLLGSVVGGGIGSAVGGPTGGVLGAAIGAGAGQVGDRYAGPIFKKILDGKITSTEKILPVMGKFAKPLSDAMARGPAAVSAFHFIMQNDAEYRDLVRKLEDENNEQ